MDEILYKSGSQQGQGKSFVFNHKQWIEVVDNNGKNYNSRRVNWDLANIANSGQDFFNVKESLVQIPLVLDVEFTSGTAANSMLETATNSVSSQFVASLKSGSYNIINAINYKINGNEVITFDRVENMKINYEVISRWSKDTLSKKGADMYFGFDEAHSYTYNDTRGVTNTALKDTASVFDATKGFSVKSNSGRLERMKTLLNYDVAPYSNFYDNASQRSKNNDYVSVGAFSNVTGKQTITYFIMAQFRLSDLHPLFQEMPLTKNISQYLSLELNTDTELTFTVANKVITGVAATNETNCLPYQVSNVDDGLNLLAAGTSGTFKTCLSVGRGKYSNLAHNRESAYIQACFVRMNADYGEKYLSNPVRSIVYNECYAQFGTGFSGIASGAQVNQLISGSFRKLRKLVIIPFVDRTSNGTIELAPEKSPFASEPSTCSHSLGAMDNFNVRIGTQNVYPSNLLYDWEQFTNEVQPDNALNGGVEYELNNGLINKHNWSKCYGFRVVDLSRIVPENDLEPKQVTVLFRNTSLRTMNYYVLVYYEKNLGLDVSTGELTIV